MVPPGRCGAGTRHKGDACGPPHRGFYGQIGACLGAAARGLSGGSAAAEQRLPAASVVRALDRDREFVRTAGRGGSAATEEHLPDPSVVRALDHEREVVSDPRVMRASVSKCFEVRKLFSQV